MLSTIRMWTQEWSDIPSRSDCTWAMCHQARTSGSALSASSSASSRRLPRVGALTGPPAVASRRGAPELARARRPRPRPRRGGLLGLGFAIPAILARADEGFHRTPVTAPPRPRPRPRRAARQPVRRLRRQDDRRSRSRVEGAQGDARPGRGDAGADRRGDRALQSHRRGPRSRSAGPCGPPSPARSGSAVRARS